MLVMKLVGPIWTVYRENANLIGINRENKYVLNTTAFSFADVFISSFRISKNALL